MKPHLNTSCNRSRYLIKFMITHCLLLHPPAFCASQRHKLNKDLVGITNFACLRPLVMALISTVSRNAWCSKLAAIHSTVSPLARAYRPRNQRFWRWEGSSLSPGALSFLPLAVHKRHFCFLTTLAFSGLQDLVPKEGCFHQGTCFTEPGSWDRHWPLWPPPGRKANGREGRRGGD